MRRTIYLLATIGTAFLLAGGVALVSTAGLDEPSVAKAQTPGTEDPQTETTTGVFSAQWGDPRPGSGAGARTRFVLAEDRGGREKELLLDEEDAESAGGPLAFNGKRVRVRGTRAPDRPDRIEVQKIEFQRPADAAKARSRVASGEPAAQALVSGSRPWVTIGCRFSDSTGVTPKPMSYFESLMDTSEPGMDHYWRELSFDNINLTGSKVVGWYNLSRPRSYYVSNPDSPNLGKLAEDCTAAANADVYFPEFGGINLVLNRDIGCCAWGGSQTLNRDGQTKTYAVTWLPPFGYGHDWVAHEMGHGLGLPHSSGPYGRTYDSEWDPMSGGGICSPVHATYECIADHTVSYHKDLLGWIPPERKYTATTGFDQVLSLDRLATPASDGSYLMAKIPIPGSSTRFYTVETRRSVGYDDQIPGEAIVIHKVDTTLADRNARVVDPDGNGNPNDAGARWLPDETFTDPANGILVRVIEATTNGFNIVINPSRPTVESVSPTNLATGVARSTNVTATFSREMNPNTLTSSTVKLYQRIKKKGRWRWVAVSASISCDASCSTVTLDPYGTSTSVLGPNRRLRAIITTGARDTADNALAQSYVWTFTTGSS